MKHNDADGSLWEAFALFGAMILGVLAGLRISAAWGFQRSWAEPFIVVGCVAALMYAVAMLIVRRS